MFELDARDKDLLNIIQNDFPLDVYPFARLGERLELPEAEVIQRLERLKGGKIIRQVSAIFDTRALGYQSSLVAMAVAAPHLDEAAAIVNGHPGVSHNYKRNHDFNLWFTIALPPGGDLKATVDRLHEMSGAESTRLLPTLHLFKIGVELDMTGKADLTRRSDPAYSSDKREKAKGYVLTAEDIDFVREIQEDLEIVSRPYLAGTQRLGVTEEAMIEHAQRLIATGHLRRIAAILYHRRAGYAANGMAVWKAPADNTMEIGNQMASFSVVSHCYLRPTYEDWPYNIFTMLHGRKMEDCYKVAEAIAETTGVTEYAMLFSTKEYKKTRVRYFTPELAEWEKEHLLAPVG
ncbi:MAG: Lrp/AsnC family transcriptional regulator [Chloroflexota bacterium]